MAMMTVYHGGYQAVEKPEVRKGRNTKDFGTGFYCTIIKEQAQRWAKRYNTKVVSIYDVRLNSDLNIKEFKEMTEEWLDFIVSSKLLVRHEALTVKHGAVVHHGTFKIVNHSVEVVHDVVHPLAVSCHYFIAHSCLVLLLILTLLGLLAALDKVAVVY